MNNSETKDESFKPLVNKLVLNVSIWVQRLVVLPVFVFEVVHIRKKYKASFRKSPNKMIEK